METLKENTLELVLKDENPDEFDSRNEKSTKIESRVAYGEQLWMKDGQRVPVAYSYDKGFKTKANIDNLEKVLEHWSKKSCLTFIKDDFDCSSGEKVPDKFFSMITVVERFKEDCKGSALIKPGACNELVTGDCTPYFMGNAVITSLGIFPYLSRNDSRQYVSLVVENIYSELGKIDKSKYFFERIFTCIGKTKTLPIPFDYMAETLMFGMYTAEDPVEGKFILSARQQEYQYMTLLPFLIGQYATFYDILAVNTLYKCMDTWGKECRKNGKAIPKCKHYGYLSKECKCLCAPGFIGDTCETKNGTMYPPPPGVVHYTMDEDTDYDFRDLNLQPPYAENEMRFQYAQFLVLILRSTHPKRVPEVKLFLPFEGAISDRFQNEQETLIEKMFMLDCYVGMQLLWGNNKYDRRASDCTSTLLANEKLEDTRVFRGRTPTDMDLIYYNKLGTFYADKQLAIMTSEFRVIAQFTPIIVPENETEIKPALGSNGSLVFSSTEGAVVGKKSASAMTSAGGIGALMGVVAGVCLLLLLCCLLFFFLKKRKKKGTKVDEEEASASEGSDDDDDDDDD